MIALAVVVSMLAGGGPISGGVVSYGPAGADGHLGVSIVDGDTWYRVVREGSGDVNADIRADHNADGLIALNDLGQVAVTAHHTNADGSIEVLDFRFRTDPIDPGLVRLPPPQDPITGSVDSFGPPGPDGHLAVYVITKDGRWLRVSRGKAGTPDNADIVAEHDADALEALNDLGQATITDYTVNPDGSINVLGFSFTTDPYETPATDAIGCNVGRNADTRGGAKAEGPSRGNGGRYGQRR